MINVYDSMKLVANAQLVSYVIIFYWIELPTSSILVMIIIFLYRWKVKVKGVSFPYYFYIFVLFII